MFRSLANKVPRDKDLPERAWRLTVLEAVLEGTIYDSLPHEFHEERSDGGEYIEMRRRVPSVRNNLCRVVVDDTTALVFSEGRFPTPIADQQSTTDALGLLSAECGLPAVMHEASWRGSVGSAAVLFRVLRHRPFFSVMRTRFLTPVWQAEAPDTLEKVIERYKVPGRDLAAAGHTIADRDLNAMFWFRREWDGAGEWHFRPRLVGDDVPDAIDKSRSVQHDLGFVPIVWMRNLPPAEGPDGACTFRPAVDTQIVIEYLLSQGDRGLRYSADPTLVVKEPVSAGAPIMRSASNALVLAEDGDAKLLEIGGTASGALVEYARALRETALESIHGNRANADKVSAVQSGRALELLHQPLLQVADSLRTSYGVNGLLPLLRMVCAASHRVELKLRETTLSRVDPAGLTLRWPAWFYPTEADKQLQAQTLATLAGAGHISRETAVGSVATAYDIEDIPAELVRIESDQAAEDARLAAQAAQVKATEPVAA